MIEVQGNGFTLTVDDQAVTFAATNSLTKTLLDGNERRIPFEEITQRSFKTASRMVRGRIEIVTAEGKSVFTFPFKKHDTRPKDAFDVIVAATPGAGGQTDGYAIIGMERVAPTVRATPKAKPPALFSDILDFSVKTPLERAGAPFGFDFADEDTRVTYRGVSQPIAGATAVVDTAGQLSRRPTLTRVAVGGLTFGVLGAVGGGLLQKKNDSRQLFILIDGVEAAWAVEVKPNKRSEATQFAAMFNTAAKKAASIAATAENIAAAAATPPEPTAPAQPTASSSAGIAEKLAMLAGLHAQGALSDEEYTQAKATALQGG